MPKLVRLLQAGDEHGEWENAKNQFLAHVKKIIKECCMYRMYEIFKEKAIDYLALISMSLASALFLVLQLFFHGTYQFSVLASGFLIGTAGVGLFLGPILSVYIKSKMPTDIFLCLRGIDINLSATRLLLSLSSFQREAFLLYSLLLKVFLYCFSLVFARIISICIFSQIIY